MYIGVKVLRCEGNTYNTDNKNKNLSNSFTPLPLITFTPHSHLKGAEWLQINFIYSLYLFCLVAIFY